MILTNALQILAASLLFSATNAQTTLCNVPATTISKPCTVENLKEELATKGCELSDDSALEHACKDASIAFGEISNLHYQFDKSYMDGGTIWNDGEQGVAAIDESRITRALNTVGAKTMINWPEYEALQDYVGAENTPYMSNFNLAETCNLNTVMCCFTDDKDDREEIPDNSEVCAHDLQDSRRSNHVNGGWADFDNNANTYCTGFTFSDDDATGRFKGNSLLDLSFRNTVENGYVKNIPGAPMCACIEQMPTVTRADCRTTSVKDETLTYTVVDGVLEVTQIKADVEFSACSTDDLKVHASQTYGVDLSEHLVGDEGCEASKEEIRNENFWISTTIDNVYEEISDDQWQLVAGKGSRYWPLKTGAEALAEYDLEFRAMLGTEPPFIIRRYCDSCAPTHRDIYYKRLTALPPPEDLNFLDLFLNNWSNQVVNTHHTDFELYSSMEDAKAGTNPWSFCNFNHGGVGFPRDCGPTGRVDCQWNSYVRGICGGRFNAFDHAFYIPVNAAPAR